jgi:phospholipase/lecithinase/hemolysin
MRYIQFTLAVVAAAALTACGGGGSSGGTQTTKVKFTSQVSFGDSLSDVGTYAVGTIKALGGGKFTINGDNTAINPALTGKNWTELMAAQFSLPAPCPAQTGLNGNAALGLSVPVVFHTGCFGYAMGGARVTAPVGPGNALTGSSLGALTVPVTTQIQNHLAINGGAFKGDEIIFVMAGGNDTLYQLSALSAAATAAGTKAGATAFATSLIGQLAAGATNPATAAQAIGAAVAAASAASGSTTTTIVQAAVGAAAVQDGNSGVASATVYGPMVTTATAAASSAGATAGAAYATTNGPALVTAMATAGAELVTLVKEQMLAKGAKYVTVNNLPDIANTPSGLAASSSTQALIVAMVSAFNAQLASGFAGESRVLLVDVYAVSHDQATNPGPYGLTNVKETACDLSASKNAFASSIACTAANLKSGDVSHYSYADDVHPTPFLNLLLARYVAEKMVVKGWL